MANGHGGKRPGAGRKPKADELKLIEKLSPLETEAFNQLEKGIKSGSFPHLKIYFEYMYGKPNTNLNVDGGLDIALREFKLVDAEDEETSSK